MARHLESSLVLVEVLRWLVPCSPRKALLPRDLFRLLDKRAFLVNFQRNEFFRAALRGAVFLCGWRAIQPCRDGYFVQNAPGAGSAMPRRSTSGPWLDWYAPPSVLIDAVNGEVLHFVRRTSRFLEPPVGVPSYNLFDIVRDSLRMVLRGALNQARADEREVVMENIEYVDVSRKFKVHLIVRPLKGWRAGSGAFSWSFSARKILETSGRNPDSHAGACG